MEKRAIQSYNEIGNSDYLNVLAQSIPQIVSFLNPANHSIIYLNKVRAGYKIEDIIGKNMFDFILPEHHEIYREAFNKVISTGKPTTIEVEIRSHRFESGKVWYSVNISNLYDADGQLKYIMLINEDISEAKERQIENININERLKAIINNTSDVICSIDKDLNLIEFNSNFQKLVKSGYGVEMKIGMPLLQFVDPTKHEHLKEIYKKTFSGQSCNDIEMFNTINNNKMYMETNYNPIYNADQTITSINIFSKNITDRIKYENKILLALKEKEILLAEIHHRIKNNLAMVSSLLQLQEMNTENKEVKDMLALSRKRIKSTSLIHELLYKNDSFQKINLKTYLTELFHYLKINENIQLNLQGDESELNMATAMPMGLMLNEIMLNSFKHSYTETSKGELNVAINTNGNKLTIRYNDFEGNFSDQIDFNNSKTTGLTLIHTFAEQLNGSVSLVNNNPPKYLIQIPLPENE